MLETGYYWGTYNAKHGFDKKKFNQIGLKIMKGTYNSLKKICISKWSVGRFWRYHLACTAHSAHFGGFFCLCTTGPSKAPNRSFWNEAFFEAYICTFHNLKSNLVELFFCQTHASDYMCYTNRNQMNMSDTYLPYLLHYKPSFYYFYFFSISVFYY